MLKYCLICLGTFLLRFLPLKAAYLLSQWCADFYSLVSPNRRKTLLHNLYPILKDRIDPRKRGKFYRYALRQGALNFVDFLRFPHLTPLEIQAMVDIQGLENLKLAYQKGKGAILITPHLGNWELGGAYLASLSYPVYVVSESIVPKKSIWRKEKIAELLNNYRKAVGMKVIPLEKGSAPLLEVLRKGGIVVLLGDRDITGTGESVSFFGQQVRMPKGPAVLALRTGAEIVPGFIVRKDKRYRGFIGPTIKMYRRGDYGEEVRMITQEIARVLEDFIKKYPEQWFVFQSFWGKEKDKC